MKTFFMNMGNLYRMMMDITLTCRLFRDIEENSKEFKIRVNTDNTSIKHANEVMQHLKETNNDMFTDINANKLELWKVNIHNDEENFSKLVLKNDNEKDIKHIWGIISEYWEEQPPDEFTHVIVDSPYLTV